MDIASGGKFGMIHDERYEERWQCRVFVFLFFLPFGSKRYLSNPLSVEVFIANLFCVTLEKKKHMG